MDVDQYVQTRHGASRRGHSGHSVTILERLAHITDLSTVPSIIGMPSTRPDGIGLTPLRDQSCRAGCSKRYKG